MEMFGLLRSYVHAVWQHRPGLVAMAGSLMLVRSVTEGAGLLLIVPLLAIAGFASGPPDSAMADRLPDVLSGLASSLSLGMVLSLFVMIVIIRALIGFVQHLVASTLQMDFLHHVRMKVYKTVMSASWPYLALQDGSRINHSLSLHAEQSAYGISVMARILSATLLAAISIAVALAIQPLLTIVIIGLGLMVAIPVVLLDLKLFRLAGRNSAQLEELFAAFGRELDDLKAAKVASGSGKEEARFADLAGRYRDTGMNKNRMTARISLFHEVAAAIVLAGLVWMATQQASVLAVGPVAVALIFVRLFPAMRSLQSAVRDLLVVLPAWGRISSLVTQAGLHRDASAAGTGEAPQFETSVELSNAGYGYPGADRPVLRDVDLEISRGTATVIVGLSGAGKTTLLDIISGLLVPDAGVVKIDGKALDDSNRLAWSSSVAYVVQDAQLGNGTVRQNITRFATHELSDEAIWQALRQAGADDIVKALPDGLDQQVGDRGQRLSRGQRQRIALARALVRRPKLLILDEATSALNPRDEEAVAANLRKLLPETTLIVVAHKLGSLDWAQRFYLLEDGHLRQVEREKAFEPQQESPASQRQEEAR
jgi:ATP-binding cassette subfamily C protein